MPAYEYIYKDYKHDFIVFLSIKEFESKPNIGRNKISEFTAKTNKKS